MSHILDLNAEDSWILNHDDMSMAEESDLFVLFGAHKLQNVSHIGDALLAPDVNHQTGYGSCTGNSLPSVFMLTIKLTHIADGSQHQTAVLPELGHAILDPVSETPSFGPYAQQRPSLDIQPDSSFVHGSFGETYGLSTTDYVGRRHPDSWIDPSSPFQEPFVPFAAYPSQIQGGRVHYNTPALSTMTMDPAQPPKVHPPWPCDTSNEPCLLLKLYHQLLNPHFIPSVDPSSSNGPMPGSMPYTEYRYRGDEASSAVPKRDFGFSQYSSPYATTSSPSSSTPGSSMPTTTHHQSSTATEPTEHSISAPYAEPNGSASTGGTSLWTPFHFPPAFGPPLPSTLPKLTRLANLGHDAMPLMGRCLKEITSPPPLASANVRTFRKHVPRKSRAVSKQPPGVSRTQRTLLPKP
jgi:hypothetical protein